jgi:hypothetical protein
MNEAISTFLGYIVIWFGKYDVHGIAKPFVELVQNLIAALRDGLK